MKIGKRLEVDWWFTVLWADTEVLAWTSQRMVRRCALGTAIVLYRPAEEQELLTVRRSAATEENKKRASSCPPGSVGMAVLLWR